jgi:hypothetical protein
VLKGNRADGVESGMVFLPDRAPHSAVSPLSPDVQQTC